jgi:hypothetical protein
MKEDTMKTLRSIRTSLALAALVTVGTAGSLAQAAPMELSGNQMDKVTAGFFDSFFNAPFAPVFNLGGGGGGGAGGSTFRN